MDTRSSLVYPEAIYLPVLYVKDKRGKERLWKVWVIGDTVYWMAGLVDGEKISYKRVCKGVNKGRSNETTSEQQAKLQMERMWTKQLDKNYCPKCKEGLAMYDRVMKEKAKHGGINRTASAKISLTSINSDKEVNLKVPRVEIDIIPMKANTWNLKDSADPTSVLPRVLKYFDFQKGVYVQWKLDGFRCAARLQGQNVVLTSNSNKQYPWFTNLRKEIQLFLSGGLEGFDALDCELYTHTLVSEDGHELDESRRFSTIQSICGMSRTSAHPLEDQICLYVFDLVDTSGTKNQDERFEVLERLFKRFGNRCPHIKEVQTHLIHSLEKIPKWHGKFAEQGFEGIIIRDRKLTYKLKHRSLRMRKFKHFIDEEYPIVDIHLNSGVDKEYFVWVCETVDGKRFKAKPMGTREEKWKWYDNYPEYIGKYLTVKFQEYTDDGIPRFPIGKAIRESGDI